MATERFAGGRGMALETQVSVKANPFLYKKKWSVSFTFPQGPHTTIPSSHEEQGKVSPTSGHGGERDDVSNDDHPPPAGDMEEPFPSPIYRVVHFVK